MPEQHNKANSSRRLSAIMFADIAGYTALMQKDEAKASTLLRRFQSEMYSKVKAFKGTIANEMGDGMLCVFDAPNDAVRCAMALKSSFDNEPQVPVRFGIHSGTVVFEDGKVYGDSVNVASRVESMGVVGAILISNSVRRNIKNQADLQVTSLGKFDFKNVDEPMEVYAVSNEGFVVPEKDELKGKFKESKPKRFKSWPLPLGFISLALLALYFLGSKSSTLNNSTKEASIAVLPFDNHSGEMDSYFVEGITEDILSQIGMIGDLTVLSRFTLNEYDGEGKTPNEIGRELKVGHLLEGYIRREGDNLRIGCQLIKTLDQTTIWSQVYDRKSSSVFAIQSEIAVEVAKNLSAILTKDEISRIEINSTNDLVAYNFYLEGRESYNNLNTESNEKAIEFFLKAIQLDSTYGLAYSGLADCYVQSVLNYYSRHEVYMDSALLLNRKAIALSPDEARVWKSSGVYYHVIGNINKAQEAWRRAIEINPNYDSALHNLAQSIKLSGDFLGAHSYFKKANEVAPLNWYVFFNWGELYLFLDMYSEGFKLIETAHNLAPNDHYTLQHMADYYVRTGDFDKVTEYNNKAISSTPESPSVLEKAGRMASFYDLNLARNLFEKVRESESHNPNYINHIPIGLGHIYWKNGDLDKANALLDRSLEMNLKQLEKEEDDQQLLINLSYIYAIRNNKEESLKWIGRSIEKGNLDYKLMSVNPIYSTLWEDQRFITLMDDLSKRVTLMREELQRRENFKD